MKLLKIFLRKNCIFILLILIALPFRFYHFTYPILDSFNFRQAQTATIALNFYKHGINLLQTELDIFGIGKERFLTLEFPLYEAVVALLYKIFFVHDLWGRLVSITAGFIGAWYLYRLVKLLLKNEKIAFFSTFFFLFAPLNMFYQRSFMIEPTIVALLLSGLYYFCHFVEFQDKKSYLLSIILLTLGFIHKGLYGPFWLLPITIYYLRKSSFKALLSLEFLSIIFIPLLVLFFWQKHVNYINTLASHTFFTTENSGHLEWNFGFLQDRFSWPDWQFRLGQVLNGIFLKPGLLLFIVGLLFVVRMDRTGFFLSWLTAQIIYFIALFRIQQQNYYQVILVPTFSVFISIGLVKISDWLDILVRKLSKIRKNDLPFYINCIFLTLFCSIFIYKSWVNTLPSFYIDWEWNKRLKTIDKLLPKNAYGIFVAPGNDWNSVYTYIPGRKMLQTPVEELSVENISKWQNLGYSFILLHESEKYPDYLAKVKPEHSLSFMDRYNRFFQDREFIIYLLR